jgi:hypothetical protein
MNSTDLGQAPEMNSCEEYNETSGSLSRKILDQLSNYERFKKHYWLVCNTDGNELMPLQKHWN